jgi:hypothetical protein
MSNTNNKNIAPRAAHAAKPITPLMAEYAAWLKAETGYEVDPMSVQLSGVLRGTFQKSADNQKRLAEAASKAAVEKAARHERFLAKLAKQGRPTINSGLTLDGKPAPKSATKRATAKGGN